MVARLPRGRRGGRVSKNEWNAAMEHAAKVAEDWAAKAVPGNDPTSNWVKSAASCIAQEIREEKTQ